MSALHSLTSASIDDRPAPIPIPRPAGSLGDGGEKDMQGMRIQGADVGTGLLRAPEALIREGRKALQALQDERGGLMDQPRKLRRVKKEDAAPSIRVTEKDPLDICLDCWVDWMAGDGDKDLGAKTMHLDRSQFLTGEEAQQARNNEIGAATDAMIDGLSMLHRWAIYTMRGLPTVWSFPRADILAVGPAAREALKLKLKWNVGTRLLF